MLFTEVTDKVNMCKTSYNKTINQYTIINIHFIE